MSRDFFYHWSDDDGGNVGHVAAHGVSSAEFAQVLERGFDDRTPSRSRPDRWVVMDFTDHGRELAVVFELVTAFDLNAWIVTPITAYEVS